MERHDLHHEFPEFNDRMHQLKMENAHFKKLFDQYDALEKEIHHINTGIAIADDNQVHVLKARLLHLKDELYTLLKAEV